MRLGRGGRGRWRFRGVPLAVLAAVLAVLVVWAVREARKPGPWQRVFATREGLTGGRLATGGLSAPGIYSSRCPTGRRCGVTSRSATARASWSSPCWTSAPGTPTTTTGATASAPPPSADAAPTAPVNRAGIDLSDATYATLGLRDNDWVEWRFVHQGYVPLPGSPSAIDSRALARLSGADATRAGPPRTPSPRCPVVQPGDARREPAGGQAAGARRQRGQRGADDRRAPGGRGRRLELSRRGRHATEHATVEYDLGSPCRLQLPTCRATTTTSTSSASPTTAPTSASSGSRARSPRRACAGVRPTGWAGRGAGPALRARRRSRLFRHRAAALEPPPVAVPARVRDGVARGARGLRADRLPLPGAGVRARAVRDPRRVGRRAGRRCSGCCRCSPRR